MSVDRILVVEDEAVIAMDIESQLRSLGYHVTRCVDTGQEAVLQARNLRPDLVLMDIQLRGELDGIAAAKIINSSFNIPVIYLTSHSDESVVERAKKTQPYGYLLKPFGNRELQTTIEIALHRHRMEMELRESEARLSAFANALPDLGFIYDGDGRYIEVLVQQGDTLVNDAQTLKGKLVHEMLPPNVANAILEAIHRTLQFNQNETVEYALELPIGRRWFEGRLSPMKSPTMGEDRVVMIARDITEQKSIEQALFERRRTLDMIITALPYILLVVNDEDKLSSYFVPPRLKRLLNVDSLAPDQELREVLPPRLADQMYRDGTESKLHETIVFEDTMAVGAETLHLEVRVSSIVGTTHRLVIIDDITMRKRIEARIVSSEARLQSILDTASSAIISVDEERNIVLFNRMAERLFGYNSDEARQIPALELLPERLRNLSGEHIQVEPDGRVTWNETGTREATLLGLRKDGEEFPIEVSMSRLEIEGSAVYTAILNDISERLATQEALQTYNHRLEVLNELAEAITSAVDLQAKLDIATRIAAESLDATSAYISDWDEARGGMTLLAEYFTEDASESEKVSELGQTFDVHSNFLTVLRTDPQGYYVANLNDPDVNPIQRAEMEKYGVKSILGAPLVAQGDGFAYLEIWESREHREFTYDEIELLRSIAQQVSTGIENAKLLDALQESAKRYQTLVEGASDVVYTADAKGYFTFVNLPGQNLTGYSVDELVGMHFTELVPNGWNRKLLAYYLRQLRTQTDETNMVFPITTREGEEKWVEQIVTPLIEGGDTVGVQATVRDVTDRVRAEQAENDQRALAEAMRNSIDAINSTLDLDEVLERILTHVKQVVPHTAANLHLINDMGVSHIVAHRGYESLGITPDKLMEIRYSVSETENMREMVETKQPYRIARTSENPDWIIHSQTEWVKSYVGAPIISSNQVIGFLNLDSEVPDFFTEEHAQRLQLFAEQTAVAVENARLFEDAQQRIAQREALRQVALDISAQLDLDALLNTLIQSVLELMNLDRGGIYLYRAERDVLEWVVSVKSVAPRGLEVKQGEGLSGKVWAMRQSIAIDDYADWDDRLPMEGASELNESVLGVPILAGDEFLGVIMVTGNDEHPSFSEQDLDLVRAFANQAAVAIRNATLYEQSQELAALEERQRLARDLHDAVSQALFSASITAEVLLGMNKDNLDDLNDGLEQLQRLTRGAQAEMRTLLLELRPEALLDAKLADLLEQLGSSYTGRTGVPVTLDMDVPVKCECPPDVKITFYRIAQEAFNNIIKHADATAVHVGLQQKDNTVKLLISDNGRGYDPAKLPQDRLGLRSFHERTEAIDGDLLIKTAPGDGTAITVQWTLDE